MKLKERTWNDKKTGEPRFAYSVKKINEFGEGITADTQYSINLAFDLIVQKNPWHDPKTNSDKVIVSLKATGVMTPAPENVQLNTYGNASFELPEGLEKDLAGAKKGDTINFALKSFEIMDQTTQKKVKRTKWIGAINKELDLRQQSRPAAGGGMKMPSAKPIMVTANQHPADIQKVIDFCLSDGEAFKASFPLSVNFLTWFNGLSEITTRYDDGQKVALYYEIVELVK